MKPKTPHHSNSPHTSSEESSPQSAHKEQDMGKRGVTRPSGHMQKNDMPMNTEQRMQQLHMHHRQVLWVYWTVVMLGIWTILSPLTFNYSIAVVQPPSGRSLWLSDAQRILYMKWSDIISGSLLIIFGVRSLVPNRPVSTWLCCFVGIWMNFAPLLFWAPNAVAYLNSSFTGMLVIALTVLIPGMPNMIRYMKMGPEMPAGWTYNPSSWPQRWIMIVTGFAGLVVSRYLAAYQLGYLDSVWDPFFGNASEQVLNSSLSKSLPVSDAGLGALAYTFEFLMGFMGSPSRWRTMPWMVTFFGILVIPLGLVHIFLVISQPLVVGHWCFFCLVAAGIMLPMIPLEVDEVIAMGQHMVKATRRGEGFWNVFWKGGHSDQQEKDERSPQLSSINTRFKAVFKASVWGMSAPRSLLACMVTGIALVLLPGIAGIAIQSPFANIHHLFGCLIVVVAVISMGEVVRTFRYVNVLTGLAVAVLPWLMAEVPWYLKAISTAGGLLVSALSIRKGTIKEQYGLWTRYIK